MDRSRDAMRSTYDEIAVHFAETRASPWPEVEAFLGGVAHGGVGLDVGCANGRHLELLTETSDVVVGADLSRVLLRIAAEHTAGLDATVLQCDASKLPVRSDTIRTAVYVATLHHLPTREARVASLDELARVLEPGGCGLVSAWSTAHDRFDREEGFDATVDWTLPSGETVPRFYHIYDPAEFAADLDASELTVIETEVSSGNCYGTVAGPQ